MTALSLLILPFYIPVLVFGTAAVDAAALGADYLPPLAILGATFEYYTKLSHFSIGADADVAFVIPHALAGSYGGYLKYTF